GKGGDVTEVGEKRMAGISGLNATVLAIQTGKKTLLLGLWDFDNISPSGKGQGKSTVRGLYLGGKFGFGGYRLKLVFWQERPLMLYT
nr:hypothetical protein [Tanacetum cinerariifolium]